jgi:hypothetical protein
LKISKDISLFKAKYNSHAYVKEAEINVYSCESGYCGEIGCTTSVMGVCTDTRRGPLKEQFYTRIAEHDTHYGLEVRIANRTERLAIALTLPSQLSLFTYEARGEAAA